MKVNIPYRGTDGPLHLMVDSTGIKVEGKGNLPIRPARNLLALPEFVRIRTYKLPDKTSHTFSVSQ